MWSGLLVDIPNGWALCDGSNGTPDMRNRFVVGPTTAQDPGGKGGAATHKHLVSDVSSVESVPHHHVVLGETGPPNDGDFDYSYDEGPCELYVEHYHSMEFNSGNQSLSHTHLVYTYSSIVPHYPKFLKLAFIMKL